jgi:hypothetical protein
MNNNKGISIVALVFMIIIIVIIAGIALSSGIIGYDKAYEAKAKEERRQIVNAVSNRFGDFQRSKTMNPLIGDEIPSEYLSESDKDTRKSNVKAYLFELFHSEGKLNDRDANIQLEKDLDDFLEKNIDEMKYTRLIRHDQIIELGIESISLQSEFLVNYYTADVVGPIQ